MNQVDMKDYGLGKRINGEREKRRRLAAFDVLILP
jgi:hypothetical protein